MFPGLCVNCTYARKVENRAGSVFWLCEGQKTYPQMPKYPRLPVFSCPVFLPVETKANEEEDHDESDEVAN